MNHVHCRIQVLSFSSLGQIHVGSSASQRLQSLQFGWLEPELDTVRLHLYPWPPWIKPPKAARKRGGGQGLQHNCNSCECLSLFFSSSFLSSSPLFCVLPLLVIARIKNSYGRRLAQQFGARDRFSETLRILTHAEIERYNRLEGFLARRGG